LTSNMYGKRIVICMIFYYTLVLMYPLVFLKGRISKKFFLSSVYITIMILSSFAVYSIASELFNISFSGIFTDTNLKNSIVILINRLVQIILIYIFFNNINFVKYIRFIKDRTLYVLGIILFLNNILIFVIERKLFSNAIIVKNDIITLVFGLCIIQVLSIYILNIFSKETEEKFILKMNLERKLHDKEIIDMYTEMIGWKHDFRNHISMISGLLQVSTKEDVIAYINEIDSSISKLDKNIYTDNLAINSILMNKNKVAEDKGIKVNLDLKINSKLKVSNIEICTVLGNLLDNSIEACELIKGYKFIDLKIVSENNMLVIKINNSTNGYVNEVKGKFLSTKSSTINGIGLVQVDNIVKKYNGYINRKHENHIFTTYVMIQHDS
ncbi:GHKL domain-containing protein, partial [Clostridium sp. AL.422]|uniref:GHKL domain-containing protein n=1 Tax=Clostridium TaxID=1485 RepID=UPI00293DBC53